MLDRVRGEFEEMPCLRVTAEQARLLFGLTDSTSNGILERLVEEGFLTRTGQGEYFRRR
jgi:Fic family protein